MPLQEIKKNLKDPLDEKKPASSLNTLKSRSSALAIKGQSPCGQNWLDFQALILIFSEFPLFLEIYESNCHLPILGEIKKLAGVLHIGLIAQL